MNKRILRDALRTALDKLPSHPELDNGRYFHFSFIVQTNKVLGMGMNMAHLPPVHYGYADRINNAELGPKIHAELSVYRKCVGILDRNHPFEMINIRLTKTNLVKLAAPCNCCHNWLKESNCSHVWFSTDTGWAKMAL